MSGIAIIGAQWGDEGKGKLSHLLSERADLVVRFNGGPNAGHTVVDSFGEIHLHHLPAGALREGCLGILAHGMVIDPWVLREELQEIERQGRPIPQFLISERAHVILPYHKEMELGSGIAKAIGTTRRGIGPAYADRALRLGIRFADLADQDIVRDRLAHMEAAHRNPVRPPMDPERVAQELFEFYAVFKEQIGDSQGTVVQALDAGRTVLFEGAQGTLLDIDFGTYPYVTSSHTTVHGIPWGVGVPTARVERVIGVLKAYTTRVGEGPFPS
jgi:adenylosuccinate synthase